MDVASGEITWHMVGPRADRWITAAMFVAVAPILAYNVANFTLKQFAYAATREYPAMELFWLNNPCGDTDHLFGFKATHGDGKGHRMHALVCLTSDGWRVIPKDGG